MDAVSQTMSVTIKTDDEIEKMRVAGRLAAQVLEMLDGHVIPGATTAELDRICHDFIVNEQRAIPAPLDYKGFPRSICTSVNNQVCHGIPGNKRLKKGDIVNIDITVIKDGFHGDTSKMFFVGEPSVLAQRLVRTTQGAMRAGIAKVCPGTTLREVAKAVEDHATKEKFSVVREYCGHGIGRDFHEEPQVLHYVDRDHPEKQDLVLAPGMCFTIEPMINAGKRHVKLLPDGWTVVTKDRSLSAQWEHTILVTNDGHEVLTLRNEEQGSPRQA